MLTEGLQAKLDHIRAEVEPKYQRAATIGQVVKPTDHGYGSIVQLCANFADGDEPIKTARRHLEWVPDTRNLDAQIDRCAAISWLLRRIDKPEPALADALDSFVVELRKGLTA